MCADRRPLYGGKAFQFVFHEGSVYQPVGKQRVSQAAYQHGVIVFAPIIDEWSGLIDPYAVFFPPAVCDDLPALSSSGSIFL